MNVSSFDLAGYGGQSFVVWFADALDLSVTVSVTSGAFPQIVIPTHSLGQYPIINPPCVSSPWVARLDMWVRTNDRERFFVSGSPLDFFGTAFSTVWSTRSVAFRGPFMMLMINIPFECTGTIDIEGPRSLNQYLAEGRGGRIEYTQIHCLKQTLSMIGDIDFEYSPPPQDFSNFLKECESASADLDSIS